MAKTKTLVIMTNDHRTDMRIAERTLLDMGLKRGYTLKPGSNYIALVVGDAHASGFRERFRIYKQAGA
jgi:hypothetical protein